ncbi:16S rRNA (uracil(1498)-N(3))-methyltransferase [Algoriphagus namhaensis]
MQLFYQKNIAPPEISLDAEESRHLTKVLRRQVGDEVLVTDGAGQLHTCQIREISSRKTTLFIQETKTIPPDKFRIHLAIAPTKSPDRMEWMVEKATELGFHELSLLETQNSERNRLKLDRLDKKMISAAKQSLKFYFPMMNEQQSLKDFISSQSDFQGQKFIAYVDENHDQHLVQAANPGESYLLLIGPEGDFSPEEIQFAQDQGFEPVSLGQSRLRTETAGLAGVHILQLVQELKKKS